MTRKKKKAEEEQTITGLSPWRPLLDDIWKIDLDFPIGRVKAFLLLVLSPLGSFSVSLVHIRPWWRSDDSDAFFRTFSIFHFLKSEYFPKYHHFRHFVTFAGDFLDFLFLAIRRLSKTPAFPAPFPWWLSSPLWRYDDDDANFQTLLIFLSENQNTSWRIIICVIPS